MTQVVLRIAASLAWLMLAGCGNKQPAVTAAMPAPALTSMVVHAAMVPHEQVWDGVVEAVQHVTLAAQTNARVLALPYEVNDTVAKGAVLVRFTDVEQKSASKAAQAQIASAQAGYTDALASYQRIAAIYSKGFVSKAQLDQARAQRDATQAALQSARAQFKQVGQQLDYTVLRAPFAGIVTHRYVEVGQAVQAGPPSPQPLIALQSLEDLRVQVAVPQSAIAAIRQFHQAEVLLAGDAGKPLPASDISVFPYADPETHSFTVRLLLPSGRAGGLYPGMTVKVAFVIGQARRLLLPVSALVQRGEIVGVYVLGEHGVSLRQLRTGYRHGNQVEVLAGLDDGERIATDPTAALKYLDQQHTAAAASADE